jgi:hypothetical protein
VYVNCVLCMNSTAVHACVRLCVLCVLTDGVSGSRSLDLEQCHSIRVITAFNETVINKHKDEESKRSNGKERRMKDSPYKAYSSLIQ